MLIIRVEIKKREKRSDGTYNVKITFTLNRKVKRLTVAKYLIIKYCDYYMLI